MEQGKKRSKNDERRQHVDKKTGLPKRKIQENLKEKEAMRQVKEYKEGHSE